MAHEIDDLVVVLPGIMGSTLHRVDPDTDEHVPIWEPSVGAISHVVRTLFGAVRSLKLPEGIGDEHPGDHIVPHELLNDVRMPFGLWTYDVGYTALVEMLRSRFAWREDPAGPVNLILFPYDWRLSNRYNGARLKDVVEPTLERWRAQGGRYADAKVTFVCHSMGGLVARWYVDHLGGAETTRGVITLGTPHRGAAKAVKQLVNGIQIGPKLLGLNLTSLGRSLPSIHQLLPEYACVTTPTGLANLKEVPLPELDTAMVADAMRFHEQLNAGRIARADDYALRPIVGFKQRTATTIRVEGGEVVTIESIDGENERGDETVPRLSATPSDLKPSAGIWVADNHGGLTHNPAAFDLIEGFLTASDIVRRSVKADLAVAIPDTASIGEMVVIECEHEPAVRRPVQVVIVDETGTKVHRRRLDSADPKPDTDDKQLQTAWTPEAPGLYRLTVEGATPAARTSFNAISSMLVVWPRDEDLDLSQEDAQI